MPQNEQERLSFLFQKYLQNTCTRAELDEFWHLVRSVSESDSVTKDIAEVWGQRNYTRHQIEEARWEDVYNEIMLKAKAETDNHHVSQTNYRKVWLAAASVILIIGLGIGFYFVFNPPATSMVMATDTIDVPAPQANFATITLADGSQVILDDMDNGEVARQGNTSVVKLANGEIVYQSSSGKLNQEIKYNTLFNPRGSKVIHMTLSDGTKVWLNAGSSITFPIIFAEKDRWVNIEGEGYFEVAHDKRKPFLVSSGSMEVKVLGTHFNINAYDPDNGIKTTLLEGSVMLNVLDHSVVLKPGEQADYRALSQGLQISNQIDLEQVMAWKNGYFSFQDADLKEIMHQISRWYDVEVRYEGMITPRQFGGVIPRSSDLKTVLKILEASNVHFRLEGPGGRKLVVFP